MADLRQVLGDLDDPPRLIQTVPRKGYRFMGDLRLKPPPGARPAGSPPSEQRDPSRARELGQLAAWLDLAATGSAQLALVGGEPGLGKSWLVNHFADALPAGQVTVGRGQCVAQGSELESFGPWLGLLADLCMGPDGAAVVPLLRQCAPSWLLQLPWLLRGDEGARLRHDLAGAGTGRMLREGCALFEALAQQRGVLLLLEDLHWADAASVDLLRYMLHSRARARLLLLATWRPVDAQLHHHPLAELAQAPPQSGRPLHQLALQPLDDAACAQLLRTRLSDDALAARLLPVVQSAAQGNPLVLIATAQHLLGQPGGPAGGLTPPGGEPPPKDGWPARTPPTPDPAQAAVAPARPGLSDVVVPGALRQVVSARLGLLPDADRRLLQAASVVGQGFTPRPAGRRAAGRAGTSAASLPGTGGQPPVHPGPA